MDRPGRRSAAGSVLDRVERSSTAARQLERVPAEISSMRRTIRPPQTTIGGRTISSRERSGPGRPRRGPARRSSRLNPSPPAGDRFHTRGGCAVIAHPRGRERPRRNWPQNPPSAVRPLQPYRRPGQRRPAEPHARGEHWSGVRPRLPIRTGQESSGRMLQPQQLAHV